MKPLFVLLIAYILALFIGRLINAAYDVPGAARIAMSVMLLFTSIGHFRFADGMSMMIPDMVPNKKAMVYITGVIEVLSAGMLLLPATREATGIFLAGFFLLLLPANIYAAMHGINYENASADGPGLNYLWFRVPLQVLFIVWVLFCTGLL